MYLIIIWLKFYIRKSVSNLDKILGKNLGWGFVID